MRRAPEKKPQKLHADGLRLANLALAIAQSSSRIEDIAWQAKLDALVTKNLQHQHQSVLDAAAEHLFRNQPAGYEVLIETMESISTSCRIHYQDKDYDAILIAAPILAWSRFEIASGPVSASLLAQLSQIWREHVVADNARISILPNLYAIDQLPPSHSDAYALMEKTALDILKGQASAINADLPKTVPFLADSRYLIGVVLSEANQPLFRWQTVDAPYDSEAEKLSILEKWQQQASDTIKHLLPGCGIEMLLPEAYYSTCREADIRIRPVSIRSAVFYLTHTLGVEASDLGVVIAGFGSEDAPGQIDEFRIGFTLKDAKEIIYGVVWPLYQQEDEISAVGTPANLAGSLLSADAALVKNSDSDESSANLSGEIPSLLIECGISTILRIDDIFGMEFCDDCSAPLFADRESDLVHAEMPESLPPQGGTHFH